MLEILLKISKMLVTTTYFVVSKYNLHISLKQQHHLQHATNNKTSIFPKSHNIFELKISWNPQNLKNSLQIQLKITKLHVNLLYVQYEFDSFL